MKPNRKWARLFLALVIGGCVLQRPPPPEPPPEPEVLIEASTFEDTSIDIAIWPGVTITALPYNGGTWTVYTADGPKILTEADLPFVVPDIVRGEP